MVVIHLAIPEIPRHATVRGGDLRHKKRMGAMLGRAGEETAIPLPRQVPRPMPMTIEDRNDVVPINGLLEGLLLRVAPTVGPRTREFVVPEQNDRRFGARDGEVLL